MATRSWSSYHPDAFSFSPQPLCALATMSIQAFCGGCYCYKSWKWNLINVDQKCLFERILAEFRDLEGKLTSHCFRKGWIWGLQQAAQILSSFTAVSLYRAFKFSAKRSSPSGPGPKGKWRTSVTATDPYYHSVVPVPHTCYHTLSSLLHFLALQSPVITFNATILKIFSILFSLSLCVCACALLSLWFLLF